jgi:hypothetical protein
MSESELYRYLERDGTWSISTVPDFGDRDHANALSSLATAATSDAAHDVFIGSRAAEFLRYADEDLRWTALPPPPPTPTPPPSPTPLPPGATPPPTPKAPVPCTSAIDERFRVDEDTAAGLGCALAPSWETQAAHQPFERGHMLWREDERTIYVLVQDAPWVAYADRWTEDQPERDPDLVAPEELYQPIRGFGKVWREQLGGPKAPAGWATSEEEGFTALVQPFAEGLLIQGEDALYVLHSDGTWTIT